MEEQIGTENTQSKVTHVKTMTNTVLTSRYTSSVLLKPVADNGFTQISLMEYDTAFLFASCFHKGRFDRETARQILFDDCIHPGRDAVVQNMRKDLFFTKVTTLDRALLDLASFCEYPRSGKVVAEGASLTNGSRVFPHAKAAILAQEINRIAPFDLGLHWFPRLSGLSSDSEKEQAEWSLTLIRNMLRSNRLSCEWKVTMRWYAQTFEEHQGWEKVVGEYVSGILNLAEVMSGYTGAKMAHHVNANGYTIVK
jgi:hypothetical protein